MITRLSLSVSAVLSAVALQAGEPLYTSTNVTAVLDTSGSPYAVLSADDGATVTYRSGEAVSVVSADGTATPLLEAQDGRGTATWLPDAGGVYVLSNSVSGTAVFSVRYSDFGTEGTGSSEDPVKIMDNEEISDLVDSGKLSSGMLFSLQSPAVSIGGSSCVDGYCVQAADDDMYMLVESSDGVRYSGRSVSSFMETMSPGPDRRIRLRDVAAIAYSGNPWIKGADGASTLTLASPSGADTEHTFSGTGAVAFCPDEKGVWTVTLTAGDTVLTGNVSVLPRQFAVIVR